MKNDTQEAISSTRLAALGETALDRHAVRHAANPRRAAVAYLRVALTCVRELARHARAHPELHRVAQALLNRIILAATEAEENCFATAGNSAPYLSVLISAESLRLRLQSPPAGAEVRPRDSAHVTRDAPLLVIPRPAPVLLPRRFVPHDQGGRPAKNGHAP